MAYFDPCYIVKKVEYNIVEYTTTTLVVLDPLSITFDTVGVTYSTQDLGTLPAPRKRVHTIPGRYLNKITEAIRTLDWADSLEVISLSELEALPDWNTKKFDIPKVYPRIDFETIFGHLPGDQGVFPWLHSRQ